MSELEIIEIKVKGIIDIINKLNDIDTIVSFDSLKKEDKFINCYWVDISIDFKGKIKHTSLYFYTDNMLDEIFCKIKNIIDKVGGYIL